MIETLTGDASMDAIADLVEAVAEIGTDEEASLIFRREKCPEGKDPNEFANERIVKSLPALMRRHKESFAQLASVYEQRPASEMRESMTVGKAMEILATAMRDPLFHSFFRYAQNSRKSPVSVQPNTEVD